VAAVSLGVEQPGREADRSSLSGTEVNNPWRYTSTYSYVLTAWCLIKHGETTLHLYVYVETKD